MSTTHRLLAAWIGAWCIPAAIAAGAPAAGAAADASGAMPGDDALGCEQIFAQGMAESQREQAERRQRIEQMRAQGQATGALVAGAVAAGGLGGTGQAAQAAVEAGADRQMAMLGAPPPPNPRLQRLKQMYAEKHCAPAVRPGDEAMSCAQIAAELSPYVQQMVPNVQALGASDQQLYAQARQMQQQRRAEHAALEPLADAGAVDPTGASKRAYELAVMAQMAKERAQNEAFASSPLAQENRAQSEQLAAQGQQMQGNARVRRLLQLGQDKRCDK
ncbi:MAG TPA: hypothetical protein VMN79_04905 [Casimicrobiaceae bacterium]|nr:hypothetical protein [Casimicrobiaceae bacterium]